jgi:hypothetical protein
MRTPMFYEIRVEGHIGDSWSPWFEGLAICHEESSGTVLTGPLADEAALHGVLMKIRDLGLPLLEVKRAHKRMNRKEGTDMKAETNQLLGAPTTTLDAWIEHRKAKTNWRTSSGR